MERKDIIIGYDLYHRELEQEFAKGVDSAREQVAIDIVQMIEGEANICEAVSSGKLDPAKMPKMDSKDYQILQDIERAVMRLRKSRL